MLCYASIYNQCLLCHILTSRFEATRGLYWDGPRNFEPRSHDEDDAGAGAPSPRFRAAPVGGRLATTSDLACNRPDTRLIFNGIKEPATLRSRGPDPTTRPPRLLIFL
ncbi:hypothetical protein AVEN_200815-1 [Araneus ventricosus]|uniref:Uncharacterized protein n=1 Tax=Araneus ventricosus TaxID=182803 RepID=A0A4Y2CFI8_ARAVE|nr:hypothetical protein AVEN_200815-1 [Araneus ventricosus]